MIQSREAATLLKDFTFEVNCLISRREHRWNRVNGWIGWWLICGLVTWSPNYQTCFLQWWRSVSDNLWFELSLSPCLPKSKLHKVTVTDSLSLCKFYPESSQWKFSSLWILDLLNNAYFYCNMQKRFKEKKPHIFVCTITWSFDMLFFKENKIFITTCKLPFAAKHWTQRILSWHISS